MDSEMTCVLYERTLLDLIRSALADGVVPTELEFDYGSCYDSQLFHRHAATHFEGQRRDQCPPTRMARPDPPAADGTLVLNVSLERDGTGGGIAVFVTAPRPFPESDHVIKGNSFSKVVSALPETIDRGPNGTSTIEVGFVFADPRPVSHGYPAYLFL